MYPTLPLQQVSYQTENRLQPFVPVPVYPVARYTCAYAAVLTALHLLKLVSYLAVKAHLRQYLQPHDLIGTRHTSGEVLAKLNYIVSVYGFCCPNWCTTLSM